MNAATQLLAEVELDRNLLIPMSDGVTLAADLYRPANLKQAPALINFNPYRKDDFGGAFTDPWMQYFAARGYASLIVDVRGTGGSHGASAGTLDLQEGLDAAEVVEWVAAQPWCTGQVGVWGMSYGGGMALAVAARQPPHLKAIVSVYGYTDVYRDIFYPGGCPNCLGRFARETWMLAMDLAPPSQHDRAGRWRDVWKERLERLDRDEVFSLRWRDHPDYDEFWDDRSVPLEKITAPTFIIGAWRDIFPEAMASAYAQLQCPKKLMMGPWLHAAPDTAAITQVDWLLLLSNWWDRWLRDAPPELDQEPPVAVFVQGRNEWKHASDWPIPGTTAQTYYPSAAGVLSETSGEQVALAYTGDSRVGTTAGLWSPFGSGIGYPVDQGPDDLRSLTLTTDPLPEELELAGSPEATLTISTAAGDDFSLVVKLNDVAPDGSSALITTGWLRAEHLQSERNPVQLAPDTRYDFHVQLWATSYLIREGHRLRVSIACADFPRIWPSDHNPHLQLHCGEGTQTSIRLPVVPAGADALPDPDLPVPAEPDEVESWYLGAHADWNITQDMVHDAVAVTLSDAQELTLPGGNKLRVTRHAVANSPALRPASANLLTESHMTLTVADGETYEASAKGLIFKDRLLFDGEVTIDGRLFYKRRWTNY
jgi:putative CocE/NonD family hydrolase